MSYPNLSEEKKLWRKGFKKVACLDEAGRGPLAGPVAAAAVIINSQIFTNLTANITKIHSRKLALKFAKISEIRDSKKLTPKKRKDLYEMIIKCPFIECGIGIVSERIIDKINILEATKLAMKKALKNLRNKGKRTKNRKPWIKNGIDYLILDGRMSLDLNRFNGKRRRSIPQKSIIKADEKVFSCSIASIIAKVTRDRIMLKYHKKYPEYRFDKHKGYGTKLHFEVLEKYGPCAIHRKSFYPVKKIAARSCF